MTPQAQLALLLWMPVVFYLFTVFTPRKAVIVSFIGGLLFLPQRTGFALPLIPDYAGMVATCYGIILAILVYDSQRLSSFQPGWIDLPMLIWCICPFASSITNGLGAYDGLNETLSQMATWGLPYYLGRLYLGNLAGLRELALCILKGGMIYVPLCLWEGRMSPNLHLMIYGYFPHSSGLSQAIRYGGYRPNVFMQHGLMVGMWMMTVALVAFWLWKAGAIKKIWGVSINWLVVVLLFTVIWCRSTGAYMYLVLGIIILFAAKWWRTSLPLLLLIVGLSYYLYTGATGTFQGDEIVSFMSEKINPDRAGSLEFRFDNEEILSEKARQQMTFGWGGWGRNRVYEENWRGELVDISVTDSLWIIAFGVNGAVGLASVTASLLVPAASFGLLRYPPRTWFNPKVAPAAVLAVALALFMLDCVLNNMFNPVFPLISGGISGVVLKQPESLKTKPSRPAVAKRSLPRQRQRLNGKQSLAVGSKLSD
ncbi:MULTISPECIES: O-antigen ligase domain-containing protein [unclassified Coleofasciculus]|uniref:O-antigen ligase domain-containing protein n=1 Tax=unclassified Coleofasciculus TaxID=2692782 RepID=UPI0018801142|nr:MULTISPECIES: O-antigen ligase domain-containing protein [unclassified Coleofasciculus]MBE9125770.1 O-antigen ligase domain-containing protein [Coleofasciculus sp. LEGE 07081]MBE9148443.1 O-antigen ligase domain-containing protein [Coleofasciculus sp. LEGE 07092]